MSDILFYNPGAFTAYQNCRCKNSQMVDDLSFEQVAFEDDKGKVVITNRPKVCSICKTPYRITIDTRQCAMITNLAD